MLPRSKGFALMSLDAEDAHADLSGLTDEQLGVLDDWHAKLSTKYPVVGTIVRDGAAAGGTGGVAAAGRTGDDGGSAARTGAPVADTIGSAPDGGLDLWTWRVAGADRDADDAGGGADENEWRVV